MPLIKRKMERIKRRELFMQMAQLVSQRSSCPKKQVGAVLVREGRVVCIGYNGTLPGVPAEEGMDGEGVTHTVHAEANIISFCAKEGIPTDGTDMYITLSPCEKCAELLVQAGVEHVYYLETYRDTTGVRLLKRNDIFCRPYTK